ncbi:MULTISPECIES: DUF1152 domain-containing protein [Catenuloplanes]|uniref:DUF1152 domain-containing protein n=1 Tax=Catenuloplanes niger TaxID=587534 RepID=A0AAE3ZLF9_9ACTN|nr:DUF1152 domain-containing protein [Catenuloplanes niger]MDR7320841.1 hypothetical protein [Catenuloplanes niger]
MGTLLVAAGGGGDAIAAAAMAGFAPDGAVGIATLAWDRLIIDPLPGPRGAADFTGLHRHTGWWQVMPGSRPIAPAGSTLPRLAAELPLPLILLDPYDGARGLRAQIISAAATLGAGHVRVIDVGGDLLGRPGDAGLRSPLADALTGSACVDLPGAAAWIAGPGVDGELSAALVLQRTGDATIRRLDPEAWKPILPILRWHPTEASALLASATLGLRGTVEIRDAGLPVHLDDTSPVVHEMSMHAVSGINPLLAALTDTASFTEAEQIAIQILGGTELDIERRKAARPRPRSQPSAAVFDELSMWEETARGRGVDYVTYRRLAEALGHLDLAEFRTRLVTQHPHQDTGLLWALAST